jgi:hypothetical protein
VHLVTEFLSSVLLGITDERFAAWRLELPTEFATVELVEVLQTKMRWDEDYGMRWEGPAANRSLWRYASGADGLVELSEEQAREGQRAVVEKVMHARVMVNTLADELERIYAQLAAVDSANWAKQAAPWGGVTSDRDGRYRVHASTGDGLDRRRR